VIGENGAGVYRFRVQLWGKPPVIVAATRPALDPDPDGRAYWIGGRSFLWCETQIVSLLSDDTAGGGMTPGRA
jgi:hypothetical protein